MTDKLFTIHYADGRVEGPLGAQVVADLIKAQIISPQDQVAPQGGPPSPWIVFPEFQALAASPRASSPQVQVARGVRVSGAMPTINRPPRATGEQPAARAARPSMAIPTSPSQDGASSGPPSGPQPQVRAPRASQALPTAAPAPAPEVKPTRFSKELIALGPEAMRDKLLTSDLPSIVGIPLEASERMIKQGCFDRAYQVRHAFSPKTPEEQLAVVDLVNLILEAQATLTDPQKRRHYEQQRNSRGELLSFQNAVRFQFTDPKQIIKAVRTAEARLTALGVVGTPSDSLDEGPISITSTSSQPARSPDLASSRVRSTSELPSTPSIASQLARARRTDSTASASGGAARLRTGPAPPPPAHRASSRSGASQDEDAQNWINDDDLPSLEALLPSGDVATGAVANVIERLRNTQELPSLALLPDRFTFPADLIAQGPELLRDRLFISSLPEVLGVPESFTDDMLDEAAQVRLSQLQSAFQPHTLPLEDQLTVTDIVEIIHKSYSVLTDPALLAGYQEARQKQKGWPSFQNFVQFSFAETSLFEGGGTADGGFHHVRRARRLRNPGQIVDAERAQRLSQQLPEQRNTLEGHALRPTGGQRIVTGEQAILSNIERTQEDVQVNLSQLSGSAPSAADLDAITSNLAGGGHHHSRDAKADKKKKKNPALGRFQGAEYAEEGDPFKGKLAFHVGKSVRGLAYVLPVYFLVFFVSFGMVNGAGYGANELKLDGEDQMYFIRNGMLIMLGFLGLLIRRENPLRIGLIPKFLFVIPALVIALIIGYMAESMAPFQVTAAVTAESAAVLLLLRSFAEAVFFHGFVTRTLLIEFKFQPTAVLLSAVLYGFYAVTYAELFEGSIMASMYAIFIYTFGLGLPFAFMYSQTRSVIVMAICQYIVLLMAALGGIERAASLLLQRTLGQ